MSYADLRQAANRELVARLAELVEAHPDLRFGQILMTQGFLTSYSRGSQLDFDVIVNSPFYEEPGVTLQRVEAQLGQK